MHHTPCTMHHTDHSCAPPKHATTHSLFLTFPHPATPSYLPVISLQGVDGGGLTREWFTVLTRALFSQSTGLFRLASDGVTVQPNADSGFVNEEHLKHFTFVGQVR